MKPNTLQPDYTQNRGGYQLAIPATVEVLIPSGDSVRLLSQIMEGLDYRKLYQAYSYQRSKKASPKKLFKVLVYGYACGIYSSRKLETACRRDINFMYLLEGKKAPDHNTLARFRSEQLSEAIGELFYQLVEKLKETGEISGCMAFVDGTKLEANANKYSFVWRKAVEKQAANLQDKMREGLPGICAAYEIAQSWSEEISARDLAEILQGLEVCRHKAGIVFVQGSGKRKSPLQKAIEQLKEWIVRQERYEDYQESFQGRNSFSKTDRDATFMHMKEDHMRNSQLKPGYNIQIAVDAEYIVGADLSSERSDVNTLKPLLKQMEQLSFRYETLTADAGYESEENYRYLEAKEIEAYIKPQTYEKSKSRQYKKDISRAENMAYNKAEDYYLCHQGQQLVPIAEQKSKTKTGFVSQVTIYECEGCQGCPVKEQCIKSKAKTELEHRHKRLYIAKEFLRLREASRQRISSERGIQLRVNRSIQAEGVFGNLKEDMGFRRFLMRGSTKVRTELLLISMAYNITKLHNKIQQGRCGQHLHKVEVA